MATQASPILYGRWERGPRGSSGPQWASEGSRGAWASLTLPLAIRRPEYDPASHMTGLVTVDAMGVTGEH